MFIVFCFLMALVHMQGQIILLSRKRLAKWAAERVAGQSHARNSVCSYCVSVIILRVLQGLGFAGEIQDSARIDIGKGESLSTFSNTEKTQY